MVQLLSSKYWLAVALLVCLVGESFSQVNLRVRLGSQPKEIMVRIKDGHYALIAADKEGYVLDTVWQINASDVETLLTIKQNKNKVSVFMPGMGQLSFSEIWLQPHDTCNDPSFIIAGVSSRERWYQDALHVFISTPENDITAVNQVALEKYVAGVVESEGGAFSEMEYFKAQAILARTFALKNLKKHLHQRYNLRDDVSSQVYHSRAYFRNAEKIINATRETEDTIITDQHDVPLAALFHANSGGQTANAGDVWSKDLPYLKSKADPFSVDQTSYRWEKRLAVHEVLDFLSRQFNTTTSDPDLIHAWESFTQPTRASHFSYNDKQIKLTVIRSRFKLRSTLFSVEREGQYYRLSGRGYGHGVGLSQDGAINMSASGFSFKDILYFYYENSHLKNLSKLLDNNEALRELVIQNSTSPMYRHRRRTKDW
jgi:stage II sporulation protein D